MGKRQQADQDRKKLTTSPKDRQMIGLSPRRWNDVSGTDAERRRQRRKHHPRWGAEKSGDVGSQLVQETIDALELLLGQPDHIMTADVVRPRRTWLKNFLRMWGKRTAYPLYPEKRLSSLADDNDDRKRVWKAGDTVRVWG